MNIPLARNKLCYPSPIMKRECKTKKTCSCIKNLLFKLHGTKRCKINKSISLDFLRHQGINAIK
jgi:hypothetical protein